MKRLADPTTPRERAATRPRPPTQSGRRSEVHQARKEAVLIVRQGLQPYMDAHHLTMPEPTMPITLSDVMREMSGRVAGALGRLRQAVGGPALHPTQSDFSLAPPTTEGDNR